MVQYKDVFLVWVLCILDVSTISFVHADTSLSRKIWSPPLSPNFNMGELVLASTSSNPSYVSWTADLGTSNSIPIVAGMAHSQPPVLPQPETSLPVSKKSRKNDDTSASNIQNSASTVNTKESHHRPKSNKIISNEKSPKAVNSKETNIIMSVQDLSDLKTQEQSDKITRFVADTISNIKAKEDQGIVIENAIIDVTSDGIEVLTQVETVDQTSTVKENHSKAGSESNLNRKKSNDGPGFGIPVGQFRKLKATPVVSGAPISDRRLAGTALQTVLNGNDVTPGRQETASKDGNASDSGNVRKVRVLPSKSDTIDKSNSSSINTAVKMGHKQASLSESSSMVVNTGVKTVKTSRAKLIETNVRNNNSNMSRAEMGIPIRRFEPAKRVLSTGIASDNRTVSTGIASDNRTVSTGIASDNRTVSRGTEFDNRSVNKSTASDNMSIKTGTASDIRSVSKSETSSNPSVSGGAASVNRTISRGKTSDIRSTAKFMIKTTSRLSPEEHLDSGKTIKGETQSSRHHIVKIKTFPAMIFRGKSVTSQNVNESTAKRDVTSVDLRATPLVPNLSSARGLIVNGFREQTSANGSNSANSASRSIAITSGSQSAAKDKNQNTSNKEMGIPIGKNLAHAFMRKGIVK